MSISVSLCCCDWKGRGIAFRRFPAGVATRIGIRRYRVVFCSDGIIEAENGIDKIVGFKRTGETIGRAAGDEGSATDLIERLLGEVDTFRGEEEQHGDQTIIALVVKD